MCVDVEVAIGKVRKYNLPGIDQITAEFDYAGGGSMCSEIHKIMNYIMNKEELPQQSKLVAH